MIRLTPIKAIRAKCLDCTCDQPKEVRLCTCLSCPLWGYRMGVRPEHPRALEANKEVEREKLRGTQGFFEQNKRSVQLSLEVLND
jgi:hypothetical protein